MTDNSINQTTLESIRYKAHQNYVNDWLKLDHANGQVDFPRSSIWSIISGKRTLGYHAKINGKWYFPRNIVDDDGYVQEAISPLVGVAPTPSLYSSLSEVLLFFSSECELIKKKSNVSIIRIDDDVEICFNGERISYIMVEYNWNDKSELEGIVHYSDLISGLSDLKLVWNVKDELTFGEQICIEIDNGVKAYFDKKTELIKLIEISA